MAFKGYAPVRGLCPNIRAQVFKPELILRLNTGVSRSQLVRLVKRFEDTYRGDVATSCMSRIVQGFEWSAKRPAL